MDGKKKKKGEEEFISQGLTSIPKTLDISQVTSLSVDGNRLGNGELALLMASPSLKTLSAKNNWVFKVSPTLMQDGKKLGKLLLEGNPLVWPVSASKAGSLSKVADWRRAMHSSMGKRVFRLYLEEKEGQCHFVDVEIVLMGDPMYPDKDEDRGIIVVGAPRAENEKFVIPLHDRAKKNKFQDPDESLPPWYRIAIKEHVQPATYLYAGVFDGHGGSWVSSALQSNLHTKLVEANLLSDAHFDPATEEQRYIDVYTELDKKILEKLAAGAGNKKDGSTAVTCVMTPKHLTVSHVGDSRCVLGFMDGHVEQVTRDHEPNEEPEKSKVIARGGKVEYHNTPGGGGVWRINGDLCMSRSFGDPNCKPAVECRPDVRCIHPTPFLDTIVIATDGLWHHVSSEESIKLVRKQPNCELAAQVLYSELRAKISAGKNKTFSIDNTMIGVIKLTHGSHAISIPKLDTIM